MMVCPSRLLILTVVEYVGNESVYTYTFEHEKRPECPVCGGESLTMEVGQSWTLEKLVEALAAKQDL